MNPASVSDLPARAAASMSGSEKGSFFRYCPYWLGPALLALSLTLIYLNPFIGDWDGLDYTIFSLNARPSSMALGRSFFTISNYVLFTIAHALFGLGREHAYLLFKYLVVAQTPLAVIACWILARDLTASARAATVAALLLACSPMLVIYGGQVMTDVPSILFTAGALALHLRGITKHRIWMVLAGAAVLGLGVNLRETVGLYAPWLVFAPFLAGWKVDRRTIVVIVASLTVFAVLAFGMFAAWFALSAEYRSDWHIWLSSMEAESSRHPISVTNVRPFVLYFFLASPLIFLALPIAVWKEWRARGWSLLLLAAGVGLFATGMLFLNYSMTINWRYFLTGLPGMAPLVGNFFVASEAKKLGSERRGFLTAVAGVILVAAVMGLLIRPKGNQYLNRLALAKTYDERLRLMPRDAVVIAGSQSVAVMYWRGIGAGEWEAIGVGAGWPQGLLKMKIAEHLDSGRRVFLDADPRWWLPCSWHVGEIVELVGLEKSFHFRQVAPTVFEIRPLTDQTALDQPHLQNLLPANRPEEAAQCFNVD